MSRIKGLSNRAKPILWLTATNLPWRFLSWWLWGSFDLSWQRKQNIFLLLVSWIGSMKCSVSTRASSRDWASSGWARNSCDRNSRTFQDSKCQDELDSIVKPHAESCNLLFYTSDTRGNDVNHGQELQSEVGHCWRPVKKGWPVLSGRERDWKSIPLRK